MRDSNFSGFDREFWILSVVWSFGVRQSIDREVVQVRPEG